MKGDGRLFKRKKKINGAWIELPTWWIAYCGPKGERKRREIRESTHTEDEKKAGNILRDRVRRVAEDLDGGRVFQGPRQERVKVSDLLGALLADYERREIKGLRNVKVHETPIREFFGFRRAVSVTPDHVRRYIAERRGLTPPRANSTINRELEILSRAYSLAVNEGRLSRKPVVPMLPEDNARKGFFEKDELDRILPHLPAPIDEMARFAYMSGWRLGEVLGLRWDNVDRSAREIRLDTSKNGEGRVLPLDEVDWQLFERLWAAREYRTPAGPGLSAYVFHRRGKPINEDTFGGQWRRARVKAKLPGKLFHDLRRTAARNMIRAGVAETVAMTITGHKTRAMFSRYNITSSEDKLQALRLRRAYVDSIGGESNLLEGTFGGSAEASRTPSRTPAGEK